MKKISRKFFILLSFIVSGVFLLVVYSYFSFEKYETFIHQALGVEQYSSAPVAIVFGAGMKKDGVTMTEMQRDRVIRAVELYHADKVRKLLMTGDDGSNNVDEVHAMEKLAVELGVESLDILIDPDGFNTYLSCKNAKENFAVNQAIVVSQTFHLKRILYYCLHQGIQVQGVEAGVHGSYGFWGDVWVAGVREALARTKAVLSSDNGALAGYVVR